MGFLANAVRILPLVVAAINAVERLVTDKHGKEKRDAAVDLVGDVIGAVEAVIGRDAFDDPLVQEAVRQTIDAVVALQNALRDAKARAGAR